MLSLIFNTLKFLFAAFIALLLSSNHAFAQENAILYMDSVLHDTTFHNSHEQMQGLLAKQPFLNQLIEIQKGVGIKKTGENKTSLFFLALLLLFLFAGVRQMMTRHLNNLFGVFFKFQISKRQLIEQLENDKLSSWILSFVYFLSLGYILFRFILLQSHVFDHYSSFAAYGICVLIAFGLFMLKYVMVSLIGWIFQQKEAAEHYLFNTSIVNEFASIFLFPLCIVLIIKSGFFDIFFLNIAFVLLILMFIYRYLRTFGVAKKFLRMNFVHFLLYLCTFEIMPILVLIRFISKG